MNVSAYVDKIECAQFRITSLEWLALRFYLLKMRFEAKLS